MVHCCQFDPSVFRRAGQALPRRSRIFGAHRVPAGKAARPCRPGLSSNGHVRRCTERLRVKRLGSAEIAISETQNRRRIVEPGGGL